MRFAMEQESSRNHATEANQNKDAAQRSNCDHRLFTPHPTLSSIGEAPDRFENAVIEAARPSVLHRARQDNEGEQHANSAKNRKNKDEILAPSGRGRSCPILIHFEIQSTSACGARGF